MQILLLEDLAGDAKQWLSQRHKVDYRPELLYDTEAFRAEVYKANAVVVPARVMINSHFLDYAPRLMCIGRIHDDTENIDFEACQKRRVRVIQAASATVRASAEFLLSNLLYLFRHHNKTTEGAPSRWFGREINDSVVALLGLAAPAHVLATMLVPLGVRVVGYDPAIHRNAEIWRRLGVQPMSLMDMLEVADAVSTQIIYASRYKNLIGDRVLSACKNGQLWTSISRLDIFEPNALAFALKLGKIGAFMMDSDDESLFAKNSPLADAPNLFVTPNIAPYTQESILRGSWYLVDRIHETLMLGELRDDNRITG